MPCCLYNSSGTSRSCGAEGWDGDGDRRSRCLTVRLIEENQNISCVCVQREACIMEGRAFPEQEQLLQFLRRLKEVFDVCDEDADGFIRVEHLMDLGLQFGQGDEVRGWKGLGNKGQIAHLHSYSYNVSNMVNL